MTPDLLESRQGGSSHVYACDSEPNNMDRRKTMRVTRFLGGGLVVALIAVGASSGLWASTTSDRAKLSINDSFPGTQVLSDGAGIVKPNLYIDHNLTGGDPCVTAWVKTDGFTFVNMDFTDLVGGDCNEVMPARTYHLLFPAASGVCPLLRLDVIAGMCKLTGHTAPRLRAEKLFAKQKTTPLAFLFRLKDASYEVRVDKAALVTALATNTRTVTYGGTVTDTATLTNLTFPSPTPVGSPFHFAFELTVERVP